MKTFLYKVSVIVPVYNVSEYLSLCLDSLLSQTISKEQIEVLLINDGSTDNSFEICKQYADQNHIFKLFTKENGGLSSTRNLGISRAKGKYLMFLDSDDMFTPETVKEVTDFFDKHYEEVDLVTYLDQPYNHGIKLTTHYRYKYLKKSGVYDLGDVPYISQTRINICVKNLEDNYFFDTTPGFRLEDQEYCSKVLLKKGKIGFCDKGEYQYNRSNEGSIVSNYFYAYYIFESSMAYFEKLFSMFPLSVPKYYQAMYINDLIWKHNQNILYPYHYGKEDFEHAIDRIKKLLSRVDAEIIYNHPKVDNFNKHYWLSMKPNVYPSVHANDGEISIFVNGKKIYSRKNVELIMHKVRVHDNNIHFMAFIKLPVYTYIKDKAEIYVVENDKVEGAGKLDVFESVHSYYMSETKTCNFYAFSYHCNVREVSKFRFFLRLDGMDYSTTYWCMPVAVFNNKITSYIRENIKLTLCGNTVNLEVLQNTEIEKLEAEHNKLYVGDQRIYEFRERSLEYRKEHKVWLYYDLYTVEKDNGYYQFMNDILHMDGIERYYVYSRDFNEIKHLFCDEQKGHLIKFGSYIHKLLYLSAEKVFTAFYGFSTISPFGSEEEEANYLDLIKFETYYLQHGVLHANLKTKNHVERCRADKIVISSLFEKENYMKNYGYEEDDLICTGMARYDYIDKHKEAKNRILFAPSWRQYLTIVQSGAKWQVVQGKISQSDYYRKFMEFLTSEKLYKLLEEHDLHLDFKLHPIIKDVKDLFQVENGRVHLADDSVAIEDYRLFITDFSSFVFDFIYLGRPVLYFVPDMEQFKSGMNHYRELDLPFEKAFGDLTLGAEDAVREIDRFIQSNFMLEKKYEDRMKSFFFSWESSTEGLYHYLCNE